jgi:anaphase-promoting complex subunit 2
MHPTIISRHFWPKLEYSDIVMPGRMKEYVVECPCFQPVSSPIRLQDQYAHGFSAFKPDKKLRWLPHLGTVNLELELEDRTVAVDVPPLEAAFIELFSDKSNDFVNVSSVPDMTIRSKMYGPWTNSHRESDL